MGYKDTTLEIIKGYNDEKRILTQSWLECGADIRGNIDNRIKEIDRLLLKMTDPLMGAGEDE
jgi:hypothetical protein